MHLGEISRIFKVVGGSKKKELASRAVWSPLLLVATGKSTWIHTYLLYNVGDLKVAMASMTRQQSQRASLTFSDALYIRSTLKKFIAETLLFTL